MPTRSTSASSASTPGAAPRTSRSRRSPRRAGTRTCAASRVYLTANVVVLARRARRGRRPGRSRRGRPASTRSSCRTSACCARVRALLPHVRVHASTQINAHNTPTVAALAALGVSRVTLAREVSLDEIAAFVAGGGDRGRVVRARRAVRLLLGAVPHVVADRRVEARTAGCARSRAGCPTSSSMRRGEAGRRLPGAHLLSPKDLAGIAVLPGLGRAGVAALKIEGRMKSAEYVALVTGVYRAALDRAAADPDALRRCATASWPCSRESFSRGFTEAYLRRRARQRHDELPAAQQPRRADRPRGRDREPGAPPSRSTRRSTPRTRSSSGRRPAASRSRPGRLSTRRPSTAAAPPGVRVDRRGRALGRHG